MGLSIVKSYSEKLFEMIGYGISRFHVILTISTPRDDPGLNL